MSALARLFFVLWYTVIWVNDVVNNNTLALQKLWIKIYIWHGQCEVLFKDIVIYSDIESIKQWPELQQSYALSKQHDPKRYHTQFSYNQFLAEISKRFITISTSWSNGKSTVTSMLGHSVSTLFPDRFGMCIVWAIVPDWWETNCLISTQNKPQLQQIFDKMLTWKWDLDYDLVKKFFFVVEACEYKDHFLLLDTDWSCITNIHRDHTDYFLSEKQYAESFVAFINKTRYQSYVGPQALEEMQKYNYTEPDLLPVVVQNTHHFAYAHIFGTIQQTNGNLVHTVCTWVQQKYYNTESTLAITQAIQTSPTLSRRCELLGTSTWWALVFSDYWHHAPAIAFGIEALGQKYPDKQLHIVFQPHQVKRLFAWRQEFADVLYKYKNTQIYCIYSARESRETTKNSEWFTQIFAKSPTPPTNENEIWEAFAHTIQWRFLANKQQLSLYVDALDTKDIICIFSAWDLDSDMREILVSPD